MTTVRGNKNNTYNIVVSAMMVALSFVLPYFMPLKITVPYVFSATLFSHVPVIISMFISPYTAIASCLGTTLAFGLLYGADLSVPARALSHIAFAVPGAFLIRKGFMCKGVWIGVLAVILTLIHTGAEIIAAVSVWMVVNPLNLNVQKVFVMIGAGSLIHGLVDFAAAFVVFQAAVRARLLEPRFVWKKESVPTEDKPV